jgi:hypothetical protein
MHRGRGEGQDGKPRSRRIRCGSAFVAFAIALGCNNPAASPGSQSVAAAAGSESFESGLGGSSVGATFAVQVGNVCVAKHCINKIKDSAFGETWVDCGGPDCGPICP